VPVLLHWMGLRTGRLRPTIVGAGLGAALTYRQASLIAVRAHDRKRIRPTPPDDP